LDDRGLGQVLHSHVEFSSVSIPVVQLHEPFEIHSCRDVHEVEISFPHVVVRRD
jgi:hypothetical protein